MTTNAQILKKSLLRVSSSATFRLNLGTTLATAIDISKYLLNLGSITEKLSKSSTNSGGVLLPNMEIELDNSRGKWNKGGDFFSAGFVNGSEITITTNYLDTDDSAITPVFVYKGLIKYSSCEWDRIKFIFKVTLISAGALLATEKIAPGILSHTNFKNICYQILNRRPFTKYLTISLANFSLGWDVDYVYYAEMTNKKVKDVLDKIMLLTGSIYYIDYDGKFIIEPITPTSPAAVCTFRGHDIYAVESEEYDWDGQYTSVEWNDNENAVQRVEMDYPAREQYQYDYRQLDLSDKYVIDSTVRATIMNNLLALYKFLKRKVKLTCKWNPEVTVNDYISLDVPEEAIAGNDFMVWNEATHNWNQGLYWGIAQPGITFNSGDLWRVVDIKRAADGEKMQLEIVQLYSDDGRT